MIRVEQWAEIRRMYFVTGLSIKEIRRRTGLHRQTIRRALRAAEPPRYARRARPSKLDPFREEIHRLLRAEPRLPGRRMRELLQEAGYAGARRSWMTICARCDRCSCRAAHLPGGLATAPGRSASSTSGRHGGRFRSATGRPAAGTWSSPVCPTLARAAGALVFSREAPDLLHGIARLSGPARRPARDARLGPGGSPPRRRGPSDCHLRRLWASSNSAGVSSPRTTPRRRGSSSGCRVTWRQASSPAGASPTSWTSRRNWTAGSTSGPTSASTAPCAAARWTA